MRDPDDLSDFPGDTWVIFLVRYLFLADLGLKPELAGRVVVLRFVWLVGWSGGSNADREGVRVAAAVLGGSDRDSVRREELL